LTKLSSLDLENSLKIYYGGSSKQTGEFSYFAQPSSLNLKNSLEILWRFSGERSRRCTKTSKWKILLRFLKILLTKFREFSGNFLEISRRDQEKATSTTKWRIFLEFGKTFFSQFGEHSGNFI